MSYALAQTAVHAKFGGFPTCVATLGSAPTSGDLVVVVVSDTVSITAPTAATGTYVVGPASTTTLTSIYYSTDTSSAAVTGHGGIAGTGGITVMHFTGNLVTSPLDVSAAANGTGTSAAPGSVTPPVDNELVVAGFGGQSAPSGTPASYTAQTAQTDGGRTERAAYWIQGTATATNPTWTLSSAAWGAVVAVFRAGETTLSAADTGVGTNAASLALTAAETGVGVDGAVVSSPTPSGADTGVGANAATIAATLTAADSGAGADGATAGPVPSGDIYGELTMRDTALGGLVVNDIKF